MPGPTTTWPSRSSSTSCSPASRALLRRAKPDEGSGEPTSLTLGDLRIEPHARRVWRGGREVDLSKTEFDLLELLVRNQGIVLDHTTIYERIWGYDFGPDSKNLAVYISYLRRKLESWRVQADPHGPRRGVHGSRTEVAR